MNYKQKFSLEFHESKEYRYRLPLLGKDLANIRENPKSYQEKFMYDTLLLTNIFNYSERAFIPLSIEPVIKEIENFFLELEKQKEVLKNFLILISLPYGVRKGVILVLQCAS